MEALEGFLTSTLIFFITSYSNFITFSNFTTPDFLLLTCDFLLATSNFIQPLSLLLVFKKTKRDFLRYIGYLYFTKDKIHVKHVL